MKLTRSPPGQWHPAPFADISQETTCEQVACKASLFGPTNESSEALGEASAFWNHCFLEACRSRLLVAGSQA